jgi:hypothetical protein
MNTMVRASLSAFFLIAGHVTVNQIAMAASSRAETHTTGFWRLHLNARIIFLT